MLVVMLFVGCLVALAAAVNLGEFVDAAAVVWAAAAVSADVFALVAAVAVALIALVLTSQACAAVTACLFADPGSAVELVHVAEKISAGSAAVNAVNAAAVQVLVVLV